MKITNTDKYLSLVMTALDNTLIPELTSNEAKATAAIVKNVLAELYKREHATPILLKEHIAEGKVIAERMATFLAELGGAESMPNIAKATESDGGLQSMVEAHGLLTKHVVKLADGLVARRGATTNEKQQKTLSILLHQAAGWERDYYMAQRGAAGPSPLQSKAPKRGGPLTRELLEIFLRSRHPVGERCSVTAFEAIPGGFAKQTFRVTLRDGAGNSQALIVRKDSPTPMISYGGYRVEQEFHLVKDVHASGLPVAEPLYLGVDVPGVDADFYVMTALPGKVPGTFLGGATAEIPEKILLQLAELLAQLHSVKVGAFAGYLSRYGHADALHDTVESSYRRQIAEWRAYQAKVAHPPSPFTVFLFDWLEQNIPRNRKPPVMVHGDFNIHNVLAEDDRILAILDWECANFGAPEQDLSWIKPHIAKYIDWDRFVSHYRACGGPEIDDDAMNFCLAFSCMRMSLASCKGLLNLQQGIDLDIRYTMIELGFAVEFMNMGLASCAP